MPNKKPSDEQIAAEVAALKAMKSSVRRMTAFGDDNHAAIDAQIEVLEKRLNNNQIHDRFEPTGDSDVDQDDGKSDEILSSAIEASQWRDGDSKDIPSSEWKVLRS